MTRPVSAVCNSEVKQWCLTLLAVIVGLLVLYFFLLMGGVFALIGPWVILVGVLCITRRTKSVAALSAFGYRFWDDITGDHLPPGRTDVPSEWSKLYFSAPPGQRRTNLHIRQAGRANQRYALLFRDYLCADPGVTKAYAQVKEALARLHPEDFDGYYDVKDLVCDIILTAAERWASETGNTPGPVDL